MEIVLLRLSGLCCTEFPLALEVDPVLDDHFEFFEDEGVSESVSSRAPLHHVVLVGGELLDASVDCDADPECKRRYQ